MTSPLSTLKAIFTAGLERVDPELLIQRSVALEGNSLLFTAPEGRRTIDLDRFDRVVVLGFGKATAKMAKAIEALLADRISDGVIAVKYGYTEPLTTIRTIEAAHPVPDENGVLAAGEIARVAQQADAATLVITLISGGGSALIPLPCTHSRRERRR
jgi:glycerate 2-kinase